MPDPLIPRQQGVALLKDPAVRYDFDPTSNVVDVYIGYLRRKLGASLIVTVRGVGYRLDVPA